MSQLLWGVSNMIIPRGDEFMCVVCTEGEYLFCNRCIEALGVISEKNDFDYTKIHSGEQSEPEPMHRMRALWELVTSVEYNSDEIMSIDAAKEINKIYGDEIRTIRIMYTLSELN